MTLKTHAPLRAAQCFVHAARRCVYAARRRAAEIGREFCCTSKTQFTAADGSLHIQTAHPKRKCNRPLKDYYEPRLPRGIGICNPRNVDDVLADHRTALEIVQRDHETKWPIHNRRVDLFKQEQKEEQSFNQWHVHL
jgi:hypothetical protein